MFQWSRSLCRHSIKFNKDLDTISRVFVGENASSLSNEPLLQPEDISAVLRPVDESSDDRVLLVFRFITVAGERRRFSLYLPGTSDVNPPQENAMHTNFLTSEFTPFTQKGESRCDVISVRLKWTDLRIAKLGTVGSEELREVYT